MSFDIIQLAPLAIVLPFLGAALSGVAIIPGVGDLAKFGKLGRYVETLGKIADKAAGNPAVKNALEGAMGKIAKALQDIPQGLLDKLPQGVKDSVQGLKDAVARFDKAPGQLLGRAHGMTELAAERARRGLPAAGSAGDTSTTAMLRPRPIARAHQAPSRCVTGMSA